MRFTKTLKLDPATVVDGRENRRQIGEALDELYFADELAPGMGALGGGATFNNTPPQAPVVEFPAGAGAWRVEKRRRKRWTRCGIHYVIYYTSDAGGGGNYVLNFNIVNLDAGDTLGVPAVSFGGALTLPAPVAANDVLSYEGVDTSPTCIPGNKPMVRFALFRGVGNVNLLRVLAVHFELLPG